MHVIKILYIYKIYLTIPVFMLFSGFTENRRAGSGARSSRQNFNDKHPSRGFVIQPLIAGHAVNFLHTNWIHYYQCFYTMCKLFSYIF